MRDHTLPDSDQNFGFGDIAAAVALATSVAEQIQAVVKAHNEVNDDVLEVTP